MSKENVTRRSFFKYSATAIASTFILPYLRMGGCAFAADSLPLVNEKDPTPQALGYHADAKKVNPKKWEKRSGPTANTQFCHSCQFYTALDGTKGKCVIFPNNTVAHGGWCNSWTQKAG